jgi:hypothetical protein
LVHVDIREYCKPIFAGILRYVAFDAVTKHVLNMARKGLLLPYCPECAMFLDLDTEALAGKCDTCGAEFLLENIPWLKRELLPKA